MKNRYFDVTQVSEKTMLTIPSIHCKVKDGSFPTPKSVTNNNNELWLRQDIGNWLS